MADYFRNISESQFSLIICGENLPFDEFTAKTGVKPTKVIRKGDLLSRLPEVVSQEDAWYHSVSLSQPGERDPIMLGMLETIASAKDYLLSLQEQGKKVILRLTVNSDKAVMGYRLMPATLTALEKIGLPLDVTSVSWGDMTI